MLINGFLIIYIYKAWKLWWFKFTANKQSQQFHQTQTRENAFLEIGTSRMGVLRRAAWLIMCQERRWAETMVHGGASGARSGFNQRTARARACRAHLINSPKRGLTDYTARSDDILHLSLVPPPKIHHRPGGGSPNFLPKCNFLLIKKCHSAPLKIGRASAQMSACFCHSV